jgi:hypothetical protein
VILRNLGTLVQGFTGSQTPWAARSLPGCYGCLERNPPRQGGSCGHRAELRKSACSQEMRAVSSRPTASPVANFRTCRPVRVTPVNTYSPNFRTHFSKLEFATHAMLQRSDGSIRKLNDPGSISVLTFNICNSLRAYHSGRVV